MPAGACWGDEIAAGQTDPTKTWSQVTASQAGAEGAAARPVPIRQPASRASNVPMNLPPLPEFNPVAATSTAPRYVATAVAPASAQPQPAPAAGPTQGADAVEAIDLNVQQAGCATCGGFHSSLDGPSFHANMNCGDGQCVAGRGPCYAPQGLGQCTVAGLFLSNLYQCLCCPDPCYEPKWVPAANASLFADYARPRTVTRIRYDNLENIFPLDRNQFFFKGSPISTSKTFPFRADPSARLQQMELYQEVAADRFSFFFAYPYRQVNPLFSPSQSGFSDLNFGTKALLYDCEMLQFSFQFRTYTPTGSPGLLGTGHWSLDPSLLASLKLADDTYLQAQLGNWIPLAGTQKIAGGIFYWFFSLNHVLYRCTPDSPLIATLEMTGWSFENGGFTQAAIVPNGPSVRTLGGGASYFNIGPGLRQSICNKVDVGGAITFATTTSHWAEPWFRFEVRFLF
jgi:hypothetical protein